jgi:hypothetical protein
MMIIDPPERSAPLETWERFIAMLHRLPQDDPDVIDELAAAERWVARARTSGFYTRKEAKAA